MEEGVAVAQVLLTADFKWALSSAELTHADGPWGMGDANASVEVSEDEERLFLRKASDGLS